MCRETNGKFLSRDPSVCRKAARSRWMFIINYVDKKCPCLGLRLYSVLSPRIYAGRLRVLFPRNAGYFESDTKFTHSILDILGKFCNSRFRCHREWYRPKMRRCIPSTWMINPATAAEKNSRSIRVMFYKRKIFLVWWSTPLMARTPSAVCGTTCGCRRDRDPSSSQSVRVKWKLKGLSVLCNAPFL